jgi:DNA-binding transcriptional regulator LsrR (DeoR family)
MNDSYDEKVLLAAYCKSMDSSLTQQQIGEMANLGPQAQVSRLLADARSKAYLREVFEFPSGMPEDTQGQYRARFDAVIFKRHAELEAKLVKRAEELCATRSVGGSPFKRLHVVPAPPLRDGDDAAREAAFSAFGTTAAEIVARYIEQASTCCVAWGRTINATVRHIRRKDGEYDKTFMPIAGEPTNFEPNGVSPSDAARTLANAWPESKALSLRGVQARIPKQFYDHAERGRAIALELASYSDHYQQIFGAKNPLIDNVAMILTGIGDVRTSYRDPEFGAQSDPWYLETAKAENPASAAAGDPGVLGLTVGNLGGVWLPPDNLDKSNLEKVKAVNERWLGAQIDHFTRCSLNALPGKRPGVVVLAVEPDKSRIIREALHLINVLVVSRELAEKLDGELPESNLEQGSTRGQSGRTGGGVP